MDDNEIKNENYVITPDIILMSRAKQELERIISKPIDENQYKEILNSINVYLHKNCNHTIITDHIDIDYETSRNIRYCVHCELTFD